MRLLYAFSLAILMLTLCALLSLIVFKPSASHQKILNVSFVAESAIKAKVEKPAKAAKAISKRATLGKAVLASGDVSAQLGVALKQHMQKTHLAKKQAATAQQPIRRLATPLSAAERLALSPIPSPPQPPQPQSRPQKITRSSTTLAKRVRGLQHNLPVATMKDEDALYLLAWRHQVEAVGNRLYARASHPGLAGKLRLLVAINADGSLRHVLLKQSSGNQELDDFAIEIVERAAPFAPFTANMRKNIKLLEITRVWRFELGDKLNM